MLFPEPCAFVSGIISYSFRGQWGTFLCKIANTAKWNTVKPGERSGSVLDSRPRGHGFEPPGCHCVVVLEQDTLILA